MDKSAKRIVFLVLGWLFLLLGVAGIFLPFLQGFLFLFVGLYFLSFESRWAKKLLDKLRYRYPDLFRKFSKLKAEARKRFRGLFQRL